MTNRKFCSFTRVLPGCFLACAFTLLSGCGLQGTASYVEPSVSVAGAAISGRALGGVIPIIGARVTLWETSSNGYPGSSSTCYDAISSDTVYSTLCSSSTRAAATSIALATTKTTGAGSFAFTAGSYTCDSSQFVYITATGGNTGAGANTQSVQIAPLGSCSNFQTTAQEGKVFIDVGEATTVVTAYTLGNFTYVTDNGTGTQVVYISAPASNNTATGSCTSPGTTGPPPNTNTASLTYSVTCTSAGLAHAFANAANIVDAVHYDSTGPTGEILATPGSNSAGIVPQALLNTIADALESCTNSASTSTAVSTTCASLFTATTPATSTNGGSTAPVNELQAMLNLAKDPASAAATNATKGIYAISSAFASTFIPALSAAPTDYSVAIWYPGTPGAAFGYPVDAALDANDNVYILASDAAAPTMSGIGSLTHNGGTNLAVTQSTAYCAPGQIATDTVGDVWLSNNPLTTTSTCVPELVQFSAANGTATSTVTGLLTPYGLAVDRYNDVWYGRNNTTTTSTANIRELVYSNGGGTGGTFSLSTLFTNTSNTFGFGGSVAIDPQQNIWLGSAAVGTTQPSTYYGSVVPNISLPNLPYYGTGSATDAALQTALAGTSGGNGIAIDANGNAWAPTAGYVTEIVPAQTSAVSLAISKYTIAYGTYSDEFEGTATNSNNPFVTNGPGAFILSSFPTATSGFLNGALVGISAGYDSATHVYGILYPVKSTAVSSTSDAGTATIEPHVGSATATSFTTTTTAPTSKTQFDGSGALWYGNNATSATIYYYQPSNAASKSLSPCFLASAATMCAATPYNGLNGFAVDSAGSLWVSVNSEGGGAGGVLQVLGSAGPTVPQLSAGYPATKP
jgi:hypothetical protein